MVESFVFPHCQQTPEIDFQMETPRGSSASSHGEKQPQAEGHTCLQRLTMSHSEVLTNKCHGI